ncbi:hypothetical protein JCM10212_006825 [Sporobolomyces blumeae]
MARFESFSSPHARLIRRQFEFVTPALLVDWVVVLALSALARHFESRYPYARPIEPYLGDPAYGYPVEDEQFPSGPGSVLDVVTWYAPLGVIAVVAAARRSFHDLHHGVLGLTASRAVMRTVVEFLKVQVGRFRPSFFARCDYDTIEKICRGPYHLVKDGRKSFPSGHSSTSWQALFFVALFLAGKNGAFALSAPYPRSTPFQSRLLRLSICIVPLFLAAYVCLTRIQDHWHHPTDVMAGSLIGVTSSLLVYSIYYRNPFHVGSSSSSTTPREPGTTVREQRERDEVEMAERLHELGNPKDVYGALERKREGEIALGDDDDADTVAAAEEGRAV